MGIVFRPARAADARQLVSLVEELGYPSSLAALEARLAHLCERSDQAVFVAEEEGELLGWVHVQECLSLASDPGGLVAGLVVDPAARRRGVGRALMGMAEDWTRARGLETLRLRSRVMRK